MPSINPDAPAVLTWLPRGVKPVEADFQTPQAWTLEEAAEQAHSVAKDHDLRPWIKSNGNIHDENEIRHIVLGIRAMMTFHANRVREARSAPPTESETP
jgi:hypothetical protein